MGRKTRHPPSLRFDVNRRLFALCFGIAILFVQFILPLLFLLRFAVHLFFAFFT